MGRSEAGEAGAWVHPLEGVLIKLFKFFLEVAKNLQLCMPIDRLTSFMLKAFRNAFRMHFQNY